MDDVHPAIVDRFVDDLMKTQKYESKKQKNDHCVGNYFYVWDDGTCQSFWFASAHVTANVHGHGGHASENEMACVFHGVKEIESVSEIDLDNCGCYRVCVE